MRSLHRALRQGVMEGGGPLPTVFPSLAGAGFHFRRGELAIVAAEPGAGKSSFALHLAKHVRVPTLYVSADSDARTQMARLLASETGRTTKQCEDILVDPQQREWAAGHLTRAAAHIAWGFDSSPTLEAVEEEVDAFITKFGEAPALLVLDNASDIVAYEGDEWQSLRALMRDMKFWARRYDMCVIALHHTSEAAKGQPCQPRSALHGKVAQVPALILNLASSDEGWMWAAPVKNRHGKANKEGTWHVSWQFFPESMAFSDGPPGQVGGPGQATGDVRGVRGLAGAAAGA